MNSKEAQTLIRAIQKGLKERLGEDECPDDFSWTQEILEDEDTDPALIERFLELVEESGPVCDCELLKAISEDIAEYKEALLSAYTDSNMDEEED